MPSKADHKPTGPICTRCGLPSRRHRVRDRSGYMQGWNAAHPRPNNRERIIGVDGEGQGRRLIGPVRQEEAQPRHVYNYLAAADEAGKVWSLGNQPRKQLGTATCLDFLLALPGRCLVFGFAFLYDLTKILSDLPDQKLYLLFHNEKRAYFAEGRVQYRAVKWQPKDCSEPYRLNYMNRRFTIKRGKDAVTVWDIFAFFQSKFTKACIDWKIGDGKTVAAMELMKDRRASFDAQSFAEIQAYCQMECLHLAQLGRQLLDAHDDAGFPLKEFYGAGSTAKALMSKYDVKSSIGDVPDGMKEPIACAFFGGRFENSVIGPVNRPVWNADINSAYPYAATFLPCLTHGRWKFCRKNLGSELERSRLALIEWSLPRLRESDFLNCSWGPLPVRKLDGTIAFPASAFSGWTWKEEFLAAQKLRPDVIALHAWVYNSDCNCQPFSFLPAVYLERLKLGKDAKGIVLKLGPNSIYGKMVQSVGWKPPFQCWVWGGNITSTCRAQLLDAIRLAASPASVLMLATDGVWSDVPISLPSPRDTGTSHATKALGGWDVKEYPRGVFAARPGIYFPLAPTDEDLQKVRARGLGRRVLYARHKEVVDAFAQGLPRVTVAGGQRFVGAKTGLRSYPGKGIVRSPDYGEWIDWSVDVSFDPRPKRSAILSQNRLQCWKRFEAPSVPYERALKTDEDKLLELALMIAEEQPHGEFEEVSE